MKDLPRSVPCLDRTLGKLLNKMLGWLWMCRVISSPGVKVSYTANGTKLEIKQTSGGGGIDYGTYDIDEDVGKNAIRRVEEDDSLVTDGYVNEDGKTVYGVPGVYICVKTPVNEYDEDGNVTVQHPPLLPEPDKENRYWEVWSTLPIESEGCKTDGTTVRAFSDIREKKDDLDPETL